MSWLFALLRPYALKLLAWGALALAVIGALFVAVRKIEKGAVSEERAKQAQETIERVEDVRQVEDDVARMPADRVHDELSEWNRD